MNVKIFTNSCTLCAIKILLFLLLTLGFSSLQAQVETFMTSQGATNSLVQCEGFFYDDGGNSAPYKDTNPKTDILTFCPSNPSREVIKVTFQSFDVAVGDRLRAFNGADTLASVFTAYVAGSGTGASVADSPGGSTVKASCDNVAGCVTFAFERNGDGTKGAGFQAKVECTARNLTKLDCSRVEDFNGRGGAHLAVAECRTGKAFVQVPIPSFTDCGRLGRLKVSSSCTADFPNDVVAIGTGFVETYFPIGTHTLTFYSEVYPDEINCTATIQVLSPGMGCNDDLNVSLSNECIIVLTPELLLEAECEAEMITRPIDGEAVPSFFYELELQSNQNADIIGNTVNGYPIIDFSKAACGSKFQVKVIRKYIADTDCDGKLFDGYNLDDEPISDFCWGEIRLEDKVAPVITQVPDPIAIPCYEKNFDPNKTLQKLNQIDPNRSGEGGVLSLPLSNKNISVEGRNALKIKENCFVEVSASAWEYVIGDCEAEDKAIIDIHGQVTTASIFGFYRRVFSAKDRCGNEDLGEQIIYIYQPEIIAPTPEVKVPCGTDIDPDQLKAAWLAWVAAGRPANDPRRLYAAYLPNFDPSFIEFELYEITNTSGDEVPLNVMSTECGYAVDWSDSDTINICGGGYKIFRTWTIYDWCSGILELTNIIPQVIEVGDDVGPEILSNMTYEVAASASLNCDLNLIFNKPTAIDDCAGSVELSVRIASQERRFLGNTVTLTNIPIKEEVTIEWIAKDACGNTTVIAEKETFEDNIAPTVICESLRTVSLGSGCTTSVPATSFDDGSFDNCGSVSFAVARAVENGFPEEEDFSPNAEFSAADLAGDCDQAVEVVFRVMDGNGNVNYCSVEVTLQDKLAPFATPANETLACDDTAIDELLQIKAMENSAQGSALSNLLMSHDRLGQFNATDNCTGAAQMQIEVMSTNFNQFDATCKSGTITYRYRLLDACGNSSSIVENSLTVKAESDWIMRFPVDRELFCESTANTSPAPSSIEDILTNNGCDFWGMEVKEQRLEDETDACYKIIYTYEFINWCTWSPNNTEIAIIERPDTLISERDRVALRYLDKNRDGINDIDDGDEDNDDISIYTNQGAFEIRDDNEAANFDLFDVTNAKNDADFAIIDFGDTPYGGVKTYNLTSQFSRNTETYVSAQEYGYVAYRQIVKVIDLGAPTIEVASFDAFCGGDTQTNSGSDCMADVEISFSVSDVCTPTENIQVSYLLKAFNGVASIDNFGALTSEGNGQFSIKGRYPFDADGIQGEHSFAVRVEDGCNNSAVIDIPFVVKDCKAPSVFCRSGVSASMSEEGEVTLIASDFDAGSIDFCTQKDSLKYFFADPTQHPDSITRTFRCETGEVGPIAVNFWVQDLAGNSAFCETIANITPFTETACGGADLTNIAGLITTEENLSVAEVAVHLSGTSDAMSMTSQIGTYVFDRLALGYDYSVTPEKDENHLQGVSTFDMILISKHILGVEFLDSPYKRIAADVNQSGTITTSDMVALRKVILGQSDEFPNNTSWRFIPEDYVFPNWENPWQEAFPETISLNDVEAEMSDANFIGIKVGDVNATVMNGANNVEGRSMQSIDIQAPQKQLQAGDLYELKLNLAENEALAGMQFSLQFDANKLQLTNIKEGLLKQYNFGTAQLEEGILLVSWIKEGEGLLDANALLAAIEFNALTAVSVEDAIHINVDVLANEAYLTDGKKATLELRFRKDIAQPQLHQNQPNPFSVSTTIHFDLFDASNAQIDVFSATGQHVYQLNAPYEAGSHQVVLDAALFPESGIYYYRIETAQYSQTRKMIFVKK
ncbi:MAG: T9SS type A sorting domain-containing protein [Bacteroidota bacterium]